MGRAIESFFHWFLVNFLLLFIAVYCCLLLFIALYYGLLEMCHFIFSRLNSQMVCNLIDSGIAISHIRAGVLLLYFSKSLRMLLNQRLAIALSTDSLKKSYTFEHHHWQPCLHTIRFTFSR
jgi:hypothetical protein